MFKAIRIFASVEESPEKIFMIWKTNGTRSTDPSGQSGLEDCGRRVFDSVQMTYWRGVVAQLIAMSGGWHQIPDVDTR